MKKTGLLKPIDAAEYLAISRRTLWNLTHRRGLPHVRIGRSVRYREQDLADWVGQRASVQGQICEDRKDEDHHDRR